jgi:phospholysine phosphohistidine inorganic pyrophosphate phosphatase
MAELDGVRAVLVDLDGVLYVEDSPVPDAAEAIEELRAAGLGLRFVTNTTQRSRAGTLDKLADLGFSVPEGELVTPAALAVQHCARSGHRRVALLMNEGVKEDFGALDEAERDVDAVVVGDLGRAFDYDALNEGFRRVMEGAELVALQRNRYWRTADGLSLDVGPFVAALEYATGSEARVMGKPAPAFFDLVLGDLGTDAAATAMIGDDVETDVGGAMAAGMRGVLVRTGKFTPEALAGSGVEPTAVVDSIADLPRLLGVGA